MVETKKQKQITEHFAGQRLNKCSSHQNSQQHGNNEAVEEIQAAKQATTMKYQKQLRRCLTRIKEVQKGRQDGDVVTYDMQKRVRDKNKEYIIETHEIKQNYKKKQNPALYELEQMKKKINW